MVQNSKNLINFNFDSSTLQNIQQISIIDSSLNLINQANSSLKVELFYKVSIDPVHGDGWVQYLNTTFRCSSSCSKCNIKSKENSCLECIEGYYLSTLSGYNVTYCKSCSNGCKACSFTNLNETCQSCLISYLL
jgi:hypothetical protein